MPVMVSVEPVMMEVSRCLESGSGSNDDLLLGSANQLGLIYNCEINSHTSVILLPNVINC